MNTKYSLGPASLLLVLTLSLLCLSSCRLSSSHLGFTKVDSTALPDCEALIVDFPIDVKVHVGERTAIVFDPEMPEQVRRELELRTDGKALLITSRKEQTGFGRFLGRWSRKGAKAEVWVTSLRGLELGSSARAQLVDSITTPSLRLILSGASTLTGLRLSAGKFLFSSSGASVASGQVSVDEACQLELEGASSARFEGYVDELKVELKGASTLKAPELQGRVVSAELSGASTAHIGTMEALSYALSGASRLSYRGRPVLGEHSVTGASSVSAN